MARRSRSRTRTRSKAPPTLQSLLLVLGLLAMVWLYRNGYFDQLLGSVAEELDAGAQRAPELQDGSTPDAPAGPEPVVPQPAAPLASAPVAEQTIETPALRGYAGPWYQLYFTKPTYPERAAGRLAGLDETIAADIDAATQRVDVATFDLDLPLISEALIRAQQRGLGVRVAVDGENLAAPEVAKLTGDLQNAGIPVFFDEREAFMHNKFLVLDGAVVWMGSANLTVNDVYRNNNNMLRIVAPELAANYAAKMDDLMAGTGGTQGDSVLLSPTLSIGGASVVNMFAPDDPITEEIVARLDAAEQRIDVLAFAYTSDTIAEAMIRAKQRGLAVHGVMESRNTKGSGSEFQPLQQAGIDIHTDGNCYIMHNKTIIIDGRTVITGSFNFTRSAQVQNDENVLIIDDPSLAARYSEEFERVYQQALQPTRCGR